MNKRVVLAGILVATPLLAVLAVSFRFDPHTVDSPLIDKPAPAFRLESLDGEVFDLEELKGTPVVLNFWSTWCPPCIQEHPVFSEYARRYDGRVQFLGVIYQDDPIKIRAFNARFGAWGPSLVDTDGRVAVAYGVFGPPETFFIDAEGVILDKVMGAVGPGYMQAALESML